MSGQDSKRARHRHWRAALPKHLVRKASGSLPLQPEASNIRELRRGPLNANRDYDDP